MDSPLLSWMRSRLQRTIRPTELIKRGNQSAELTGLNRPLNETWRGFVNFARGPLYTRFTPRAYFYTEAFHHGFCGLVCTFTERLSRYQGDSVIMTRYSMSK